MWFFEKQAISLHIQNTFMIYVRDKGQMCNNILQFAHVYSYAREHNLKCISMRFAYKYQYFNICRTAGHNFFNYILAKFAAKAGLLPVIDFDDENTDTSMLAGHRNFIVQGWNVRFYDLFLKYRHEILDLFSFLPEIENMASLSLSKHPGKIKLGVHVRRGDYARWYGGKYLFSHSQYAGQIQRFALLFPEQEIATFICTNDPAGMSDPAYRNLPSNVDIVFPDGNPGEDLCILSHCDYLIGAPSTFSLVASMYHDTPLYWIEDADKPFEVSDFRHFDYLFRHIK